MKCHTRGSNAGINSCQEWGTCRKGETGQLGNRQKAGFSSSVHEEEVQSTHLSLIKQATLVSMCNMTYVNQVASHLPIFGPTFASDYPTYMYIPEQNKNKYVANFGNTI